MQTRINVSPRSVAVLPPQVIPTVLSMATSDDVLVCPVFIDEETAPDRMAVVTVKNTSQVSVIIYSLVNGQWMFDDRVDTEILTRNLTFTSASATQINACAIADPGSASGVVVFVTGNVAADNPDTFRIDSIHFPDGGPVGATTAVTIAGSVPPPNRNNVGVCGIPLSATSVMHIERSNGHIGTISGDEAGFTITYDTRRSTIDSDILVFNTITQEYSGWRIGDEILLLKTAPSISNSGALWKFDADGENALEHDPFRAAGMGNYQDVAVEQKSRITRVGERWAIAWPSGGGDPGTMSAFNVTVINVEGFF